jgi:2-C-methyl-D-erythritol 4-phosphate cytidylyltransferase
MNTAIIVAAGTGSRFGGNRPKQFLPINGKPILIYTIERFQSCPAIDEIILVLSIDEIKTFSKELENHNLPKLTKIVAGGQSRSESVFNGINAIIAEKNHLVAVHDGARPMVTVAEIEQTIKKADETGAACLVADVTETIQEVSGSRIIKTVDRTNLRRALTPQTFRLELLKKAFDEFAHSEDITDECSLVEKLGVKISIVKGSSKNIKITHAEDLLIAEVLLREFG